VLYTVPTGKLAIAAPNAPAKATQITLKVEALKLGSKSPTTLGTFSFTAGCSSKVTALQNAFALAEGTYNGAPSTLIWAQPSLVAVQSTCGAQGLTILHIHGGKNATLPTWSGGVLSPDGSTIAATVAGSKPGSSTQVGLITVASGKTQVLAPKLNAGSVAWSPDNKNLYVASMPTNPKSGSAQIYTLSKNGKTAKSVYSTHAAGIFHLSPLKVSPNVAFTTVASSPANAVVPPATLVENLTLGSKLPAQALLQGGQGAWRP
jgi:dipeptidyl aminopeptidase/acylaminoacyl peptidase